MPFKQTLLGTLLTLAAVNACFGEIYKWTDAQGNVHYSDCEERDCGPNATIVDPDMTNTTIYTPPDVDRTSKSATITRSPAATTTPEFVIHAADVACDSAPAELLGREIELDVDTLNLKRITPKEASYIEGILSIADGKYEIGADIRTCVGKESREERKQLKAMTTLSAKLGELTIADMILSASGLDKQSKKGYWWLVEDYTLHAGEAGALSPKDIRWEVELLNTSANEFVYLTRQRQVTKKGATVVRKIMIGQVVKDTKQWRFHRYYYTQGKLTGKEIWTIRF